MKKLLFFTLASAGLLTVSVQAGQEVYKQRVGGSSYTASPVAADGRIYLTTEDGEVRVLKAGPKCEILAVNKLDDNCMATPAISNGSIFFRTQHYLIAAGKK